LTGSILDPVKIEAGAQTCAGASVMRGAKSGPKGVGEEANRVGNCRKRLEPRCARPNKKLPKVEAFDGCQRFTAADFAD
jgi:hypothetical protein